MPARVVDYLQVAVQSCPRTTICGEETARHKVPNHMPTLIGHGLSGIPPGASASIPNRCTPRPFKTSNSGPDIRPPCTLKPGSWAAQDCMLHNILGRLGPALLPDKETYVQSADDIVGREYHIKRREKVLWRIVFRQSATQ